MIQESVLRESEIEWNRAKYLHQNFLSRKEKELDKASEDLWGAINSLLSAIHRIKTGRGLGRHKEIRNFAEEICMQEGIENLFRDAEDMHHNFYHNIYERDELLERVRNSERFYDLLEYKLAKLVKEE
ncbi:MAG: PaREP1 family protein [Candidatus Methanospirareceae archaeon]